jgi:hypothetical protein
MGQPLPGIEIGNVAAGHKRPLAGAGDDDHVHRGIRLQHGEGLLEGVHRRHVERVQHARAVDGEHGDRAVAVGQDRGVRHGVSSG